MKKKWKINGDTMTTIVVSSLIFCVVIVIWGMAQAQHGIDSSAIVDSALRIFGTELGICGVMTIFQRWIAAQDKRLEQWRNKRKGQTK